jgi:hypothetical protein
MLQNFTKRNHFLISGNHRGGMFLRNFGAHLQVHMALQPEEQHRQTKYRSMFMSRHQIAAQTHNVKVTKKYFENVAK